MYTCTYLKYDVIIPLQFYVVFINRNYINQTYEII